MSLFINHYCVLCMKRKTYEKSELAIHAIFHTFSYTLTVLLHSERSVPIEFVATSRLPTAFGDFNISVFQDPNGRRTCGAFFSKV